MSEDGNDFAPGWDDSAARFWSGKDGSAIGSTPLRHKGRYGVLALAEMEMLLDLIWQMVQFDFGAETG